MKNRCTVLAVVLFLHFTVHGQVKIGNNATTINTASLLELETTNKGLVLPRVSITSTGSSSPLDAGLLTGTVVYNTNASITGGSGAGVYYWDGTKWNFLTNTSSLSYWSLTGNSGTNASTNFIGTTDAVDFVTRTNNTERLRITSGGNVGIGLSNPSYALSVLSASNPLYLSGVQATSTLSNDSIVTINAGIIKKTPYSSISGSFWGLTGNSGTNASTNFIGTTDAIDFVAKTNNVDRIHILGTANGSSQAGWVGMGVSLPRSSLDVTGNYSNKNVITIQNTSSSGYSSVDMLDNTGSLKGTFGYGNSGTGAFFGSRDYFSTYSSDFVLNNNSGNYNFFMKGSTGYIGINTGTPSERLHVVGNIYLNGAFMPGGDPGTSGYVLTSAGANTSPTWTNLNTTAWKLTGNSGTTASTASIGTTVNNNFIGTTDAKDWVIATNNLEHLRVASNGNIGINNISPTALVDIVGSSITSGNVMSVTANGLTSGNALNISSSSSAGTSSSLINLTRSGSSSSQTAYGIKSSVTASGASSTNIAAQFSASGATNNYGLIIPSGGGNVGIGTSTPSNALEVDGTDPIKLVGLQKGTLSVDSVLVITSSGVVKKQKPLDNVSLTKYLYTVTLPNISNNGGATLDVTVQNTPYTPGGPNPVITVNPEGGLPSGVVIAWVNVVADNTVRIQFRNVSNVGVSSQSVQFDVTVIQ